MLFRRDVEILFCPSSTGDAASVQLCSIFSLLQYRSLTNNKAVASLYCRRPQMMGQKPAGLLGTSHCNFQAHKVLPYRFAWYRSIGITPLCGCPAPRSQVTAFSYPKTRVVFQCSGLFPRKDKEIKWKYPLSCLTALLGVLQHSYQGLDQHVT